MADNANTNVELKTETLRLGSAADSVTINNNLETNALLLANNLFHGTVSVGYVKAGESLSLPTIVNIDCYALVSNGSNVFMRWPGPVVTANRKKINLTPGQTYSLSDFGPANE